MIHIVTPGNRHLYARQVGEMFNQRRRDFVQKAAWKGLLALKGAEVDELDDDRAVYLLALDDDLSLLGAVRCRPTDDRSILSDRFGHVVAAEAPPMKGKEVWETSRMLVSDNARRRLAPGLEVRQALDLAALEVANDAGARRLVSMMELEHLPKVANAAWNVRMAGPPVQHIHGVMVAVWTAVSPEEVARLRKRLAEPARISYLVEDDDVEAFGSLTGVQREFERARAIPPASTRLALSRARHAITRIDAMFARLDSDDEGWPGNVIPLPLRR